GHAWSGLTLSWDQIRSALGPTNWHLDYSPDGLTFTRFDTTDYSFNTGLWTSGTYSAEYHQSRDLSLVTALNDALNAGTTIYFRMVANTAPSNTIQTARIDNFTVLAVVPEPATWALLGTGFLLFRRHFRRAR